VLHKRRREREAPCDPWWSSLALFDDPFRDRLNPTRIKSRIRRCYGSTLSAKDRCAEV